jgi:DNA-binding NtrC family response regulator
MRAVLVVDDDAGQLQVRKLILAGHGFVVCTAAGVDEALAKLSGDPSVSVLVTDHNLAGRCGTELVRAARLLRPALPVLVLSGMPGLEEKYAGLNVTLCSKPFPPEMLIQLVSDAMAQPD